MKSAFKYILLSVFLLILTEGMVRLIGIPVFPQMEPGTERSEPKEYAGFHPMYGPYPVPGKYQVIFSKVWCQVTHTKDSSRITRSEADTTDYAKKPKLNFYGCSFTWGTGISDSSTYPFLVQTALQSFNVQNKGVFAAGTIVSYLQLKEEIRRHQQPAIAIIAYASFHDQRNTMNREWATFVKESFKTPDPRETPQQAADAAAFIDSMKFPQARLIKDSLQIIYQPLQGRLFPFCKYSAICNGINYYISTQNEKKLKSNAVTRKLFYEINEMCKKNNIRLIIACIDQDKNTSEMQDYFKKLRIEYLSFGVDYEHDNNYNLYPDLHPNEKANAIYARKIVDYLALHPGNQDSSQKL